MAYVEISVQAKKQKQKRNNEAVSLLHSLEVMMGPEKLYEVALKCFPQKQLLISKRYVENLNKVVS